MRLFESVFRCLADLAAQRPTLPILEDVHRAQTSSLDLLHFLLRRITGAPVMVLITYRDDETRACTRCTVCAARRAPPAQ